jgi:hypothetical protein
MDEIEWKSIMNKEKHYFFESDEFDANTDESSIVVNKI